MTFKDNLSALIQKLDIENKKAKDITLSRIIAILKTMKDSTDLEREKGLIIRIVIDSVENMIIGEAILTFVNNYTNSK